MSEEERKTLRVMIAAPSDLNDERQRLPEIIAELNATTAADRGVELEALGWEDALTAQGRPQLLVDADVERCDLLLVLFWKRWGAPTIEYTSDVEWTLALARQTAREYYGRPAIWLYFKTPPEEMLADPGEQLQRVLALREEVEQERVLPYTQYQTADEWEELLAGHLSRWLDDLPPAPPPPDEIALDAEIEARLRGLEEELRDAAERDEMAVARAGAIAADLALKGVDAALSGRYTRAERLFAQSLQTVELPDALLAYANVLAEIGQHERAIDLCNRALDHDADLAAAYRLRGVASYEQGDLWAAEEDLTCAIGLQPDAQAYRVRGAAYGERGDVQGALDDYTRAIELQPDDAEAYNERGLAYDDGGYLERAIEDYTRAIELQPDYAEALNNRAFSYIRRGQYGLALEDIEEALRLSPDDAVMLDTRGCAYAGQRRYDLAIANYDRALALQPDLADAWYHRAQAREALDHIEQAIEDYRRALELAFSPALTAEIERRLGALGAA